MKNLHQFIFNIAILLITFNIGFAQTPIAVDDNFTFLPNTSSAGSLIANDLYTNNGLSKVYTNSISSPIAGSFFNINPEGIFTYLTTHTTGVEQYQYRVCNAENMNNCDTATVTIQIGATPNDFIAVSDYYFIIGNQSFSSDFSQNDIGFIASNAVLYTTPSNGVVGFNANGIFTYAPNPNFTGIDFFTYYTCDPISSICDTASVFIQVADKDFDLNDDHYIAPSNGSFLGNLKDNDFGYSVVVPSISVTLSSGAAMSIFSDGSFNYTVVPNFIGTDSLTYYACDSTGVCDSAKVYINALNAQNYIVAADDEYVMFGNMTLSDNLFTNDLLVSNPVTASFTSTGNYGTATLNASTGDFTYMLNNPLFNNVTDTLMYQVCNAQNVCDSALLTIRVQYYPEPIADHFTMPSNGIITGNLMANDIFPVVNGVPLVEASLYPNIPPSHGVVNINTDGTFIYTPDSTFTTSDIFKYSLCSTQGMNPPCDTATVYINVIPNYIAINDDYFTTYENTPFDGQVLLNDSSSTNNLIISVLPLMHPTQGAFVLDTSDIFTYTPNLGFIGVDSFTYVACDSSTFLCDTATVYINVLPNFIDANDDYYSTDENTPLLRNVLGNDNSSLPIVSITPLVLPTAGTVVLNVNGTFSYTPSFGFTGQDSYVYEICNTAMLCDTATVYIDVLSTGGTTEVTVAYGSTIEFHTPTFPILDSTTQSIVYACDTLNNAYLQNNSSFSTSIDSGFIVIPTSIGSDTTCIPLADGTIHTIIVHVVQGVWPGDTDTSALVNHWDLLNIGLAYGSTGFARPNASIVWDGYVAQDWLQNTPVSLIDYKHIDTDGNGVIDVNDTLAISQNWGQSYTKNGGSSNGTIPLYVATDTLITNGNVAAMPIILGSAANPAVDCYGVAFTIQYDNNLIKDSTVTSIDFTNSWLGTLGQNVISIQKDFSIDGEIQVAITRTDGNNLTGFGQIGTLRYTIKDDIMRNSNVDFDFTIKDVKVIAFDELPLDIDAQTSTLSIDTTGVSTRNIEAISKVALFPNPTMSQLNIQSNNEPIESLRIFSFDGKELQNIKINNTNYALDVTNYSAGLYIVHIKTLSDTIIQRFIKLK